MVNKNPPPAPKKAPPKGIPPSSRYYTTNKENDNLTEENVDVEELTEENLQKMVNETKLSPGNRDPNYSKSILNYKPKVPKMKLPPGISGGKRTRRKRSHRKSSRKH